MPILPSYINQSIWSANQLTGIYMSVTLVFNGSSAILSELVNFGEALIISGGIRVNYIIRLNSLYTVGKS